MKEGQFKSNLRATVFTVEANGFEQHMLWVLHAYRVNWLQRGEGTMVTLGTLDGRPVVLSLRWAVIDNCSVLFYHPQSEVADYAMVERWLAENCTPPTWGGGRAARCDAQNFHQCLSAIEEYRNRCLDLIEQAPRGRQG
jgi:hypothetical protein